MSLDVKKTTKISIFYLLHYSMYKTLVNKGLDPIHPGAFIHSSLILHTTLMIYVLYNRMDFFPYDFAKFKRCDCVDTFQFYVIKNCRLILKCCFRFSWVMGNSMLFLYHDIVKCNCIHFLIHTLLWRH